MTHVELVAEELSTDGQLSTSLLYNMLIFVVYTVSFMITEEMLQNKISDKSVIMKSQAFLTSFFLNKKYPCSRHTNHTLSIQDFVSSQLCKTA